MRGRFLLLVLLGLGACESSTPALAPNDGGGGGGGGDDGSAGPDGSGPPGPDASAGDGDAAPSDAGPEASDAGPVGVGYFRVADLASDGPAFDVCLSTNGAPSDYSASTPVFGSAISGGLVYTDVTKYQAAPAGSYGVRFVAPGSSGCGTAVSGLADAALAVQDGAFATLVAGGLVADAGSTPFVVKAFADDPPYTGTLEGGTGNDLRLVHFAPGASTIDFGTGTLADGDFVTLFAQVPYAGTAAPGANGIDTNGYLDPADINSDTLSVHSDADAGADLASWQAVTVNPGDVSTIFLVAGDSTRPVNALLCLRDYASPAGALNTSCSLLP